MTKTNQSQETPFSKSQGEKKSLTIHERVKSGKVRDGLETGHISEDTATPDTKLTNIEIKYFISLLSIKQKIIFEKIITQIRDETYEEFKKFLDDLRVCKKLKNDSLYETAEAIERYFEEARND